MNPANPENPATDTPTDPTWTWATSPDPRERRPVNRFGRWFTHQFTRYFHRLTVVGDWPLPPAAGAILVCNHISGLDPVFLQEACPRLVTWMMAKEYYDTPGVHWFCNQIQAIPVERSGRDLAATRTAIRALEQGQVLGVFPEGKIETTNDLLPFQVGVGMLALKSGAPVVPAYMEGTQRGRDMLEAYASPTRCTLWLGPALRLTRAEGRGAIEAATNQIQDAVSRLRERAWGQSRQPA